MPWPAPAPTPTSKGAGFALAVRDDVTGRGFGSLLMRRLIEYTRERGIGETLGHVLRENRAMLANCRSLGFEETADPDDPGDQARWAAAVRQLLFGAQATAEAAVNVPLADKVAFLGAAESHARERPGSVEALETHMSWVFLTDRFAYKLKKPVCHPLIDLRPLEARRRNCLVETRLNRRLAPDVYLGIEPLTLAPHGDGLRIGGDGKVVDWLVVMRRLPEMLMLDRALQSGGPERHDLDRIALRLARFYQELAPEPVAPDARRHWYRSEIELSWRELSRGEFALDRVRIERIAGRLGQLLRSRPDLLLARHQEGRIVEGHGDLRPEHICLEREPVIIDCLEFSRALRLVDPADEMAFLALECAMLGHADVGAQLQRSYETITGDRPPEPLISWYMGFRAFLRARLLAIHSLDPGPRSPAEWVARAERYLNAALSYTEALA
jgi:aminoglycoside phosphotransferase family enzyme